MTSSSTAVWILCFGFVGAPARSAQPPSQGTPPAASQPRRTHVVTKLAGFELTAASKVDTQTTVAGASRGTKTVVPLAPRLGRAVGAQPVLTWMLDGAGGAAFLVRVYNEDEDVVYEATVSDVRYTYQGPPLRPGKTYYWTVEAVGARDTRSSMTGIRLASAAERLEIERQLPAATADEAGHLARAKVFVDRRAWYDALAETDAAVAAAPSSAAAHELRGQLFAQLPALQAMADVEFAKADALGRGR